MAQRPLKKMFHYNLKTRVRALKILVNHYLLFCLANDLNCTPPPKKKKETNQKTTRVNNGTPIC